MPNTRPNKNIPTEQENPLFHDTWKLLKNYRDAVWNLELAVQQVRSTFEIQKADTQPSGLYRYSLRLPNQPKHKSPPNGLTDFLRGFTSREAGSQGEYVNDPASVIIPLYFVWCIKETSDMVNNAAL